MKEIELYRPIYDKYFELVILDEKNHSFPLHLHGSLEIMYVLSGDLISVVGKDVVKASSDEIVLVCPYTPHAYSDDLEHERICIVIPETFLQEMKGSFAQHVSCVLRNKETNRVLLKIIQDYKEYLRGNQSDFISAKGFCLMLFGIIDKAYNIFDKSEKLGNLTMIESVIKYINENYREPISLKDLVEATKYNRYYISKEFNKNFHMSITEYVNRVRLMSFISQINGESNITTIALDCGFNSISSFYTAFKKEFGMTPKEYLRVNDKIYFGGKNSQDPAKVDQNPNGR